MTWDTDQRPAYRKAYRERNHERLIAADRERYAKNHQELLAKAKHYYVAHREQRAQYYQTNRERVLGRIKQYNREHIVAIASVRLNRKTDPPELVAVAELIKETRTLLKDRGQT